MSNMLTAKHVNDNKNGCGQSWLILARKRCCGCMLFLQPRSHTTDYNNERPDWRLSLCPLWEILAIPGLKPCHAQTRTWKCVSRLFTIMCTVYTYHSQLEDIIKSTSQELKNQWQWDVWGKVKHTTCDIVSDLCSNEGLISLSVSLTSSLLTPPLQYNSGTWYVCSTCHLIHTPDESGWKELWRGCEGSSAMRVAFLLTD